MSAEEERSLDVAKTATIDVMALNNKIVSMRGTVKKAKARVIQKLVRQIQVLRKKKGQAEMLEKNTRKADRFVEEIHVIKHLKSDKISKFAMGNTISLAEVCKKGTASIELRALTRLSETPVIKGEVTKFRSCHSDWPSLTAFLLMKQSGRRYKKKKNVQTTDKIEANIKARETMMQTYLGKKNIESSLQVKHDDDEEERHSSDSERTSFTKVEGKSNQLQETEAGSVDSDSDDDDDDDGDDDDSDDDSDCERSRRLQEIHEERTKSENSMTSVSHKLPVSSPSKQQSLPTDVSSAVSQNSPKKGIKLEVLQNMFSSRTDDSIGDSDSNHEDSSSSSNVKSTENRKQQSKKSKARAKIMKEMLPQNSSDDNLESDSDSDESQVSEDSSKPNIEASVPKNNSSGIMVVKKINLDNLENDEDLKSKPASQADVPDILTSKLEVKKSKDAFFVNSDDDSDGEDEEAGDDSSSEDSSQEEKEEEEEGGGGKMITFESTFIGTLAHKKRLKWEDRGKRGDNNEFSNLRGQRGSWRDGRGRSRGGREGGSDRGREGGSDRGRGDFSGGRGGGGYPSEGRWSESSRGQGQRGSKYGQNRFDRESSRGRGGQWTSSSDFNRSTNISAKSAGAGASKPETLHPSWEASKRKKEQSGILQFKGKKIKFDD